MRGGVGCFGSVGGNGAPVKCPRSESSLPVIGGGQCPYQRFKAATVGGLETVVMRHLPHWGSGQVGGVRTHLNPLNPIGLQHQGRFGDQHWCSGVVDSLSIGGQGAPVKCPRRESSLPIIGGSQHLNQLIQAAAVGVTLPVSEHYPHWGAGQVGGVRAHLNPLHPVGLQHQGRFGDQHWCSGVVDSLSIQAQGRQRERPHKS